MKIHDLRSKIAAAIQQRGVVNHDPCGICLQGNVPSVGCVYIEGLQYGRCGNCIYEGQACSNADDGKEVFQVSKTKGQQTQPQSKAPSKTQSNFFTSRLCLIASPQVGRSPSHQTGVVICDLVRTDKPCFHVLRGRSNPRTDDNPITGYHTCWQDGRHHRNSYNRSILTRDTLLLPCPMRETCAEPGINGAANSHTPRVTVESKSQLHLGSLENLAD